jgi:hypothetical protein
MSFAAVLLVGWMMALPYVVLGWLFYRLGLQAEQDAADPVED